MTTTMQRRYFICDDRDCKEEHCLEFIDFNSSCTSKICVMTGDTIESSLHLNWSAVDALQYLLNNRL